MTSESIGEPLSRPTADISKSHHSVTDAIENLIAGENVADAVDVIVGRYQRYLAKYADKRIGARRGILHADGEDVCQDILDDLTKFLLTHEGWVVARAVNRKGLVMVMQKLAKYRVSRMVQKATNLRAGGGNVVRESALPEGVIAEVGRDDPPEERLHAAEKAEVEARMLRTVEERLRAAVKRNRVKDMGDRLVKVFNAWLEGRSTAEIAVLVDRDERTVQRLVKQIRDVLEADFGVDRKTKGGAEAEIDLA